MARAGKTDERPNIVFIMADDHAAHAIGCYGSRINTTPNIDRIANEGMLFKNCFCTNSICAPSRAVILTGKHSHLNGVLTLLDTFDGRQQTFPKLLRRSGYQTAMIGKWHLGEGGFSDPAGFDYWSVLHGQGPYFDPVMLEMGADKPYRGYTTDIIGDLSVEFVKNRDKNKPFLLMCHHKAPHRSWEPDEKHAHMYEDMDLPEPETFHDTYENREYPARDARMRVERHFHYKDLKLVPPEGASWDDTIAIPETLEGYTLTPAETGLPVRFNSFAELKNFKYQRYIKDYLRCVASLDDAVGRLLDCLDEEGITNDTIVVYTSDQGFFLGDHGWFDKRFMYEESLRMPFIVRYPARIRPNTRNDKMVLNLDFAATFLDYAQIPIPGDIQGKSLKNLLEDDHAKPVRDSFYYRYWMNLGGHHVWAHYGIRTSDYKLIYYYSQALGTTGSAEESREPVWELFDLQKDRHEMRNVYHDPAYLAIREELKNELYRVKAEAKDDG